MSGGLWVIGTPIGNLGDISTRAIEVLASLDVLVCEDTRRTGGLLHHLGIVIDRLVVANDHNEATMASKVVDFLDEGKRVGLVSDAGMPVISDPGFRVISAAIRAGHDPIVIPGPTAVASAVALSGIEAHRYVFEGFLPRKGQKRAERLDELSTERRAIVIYESPNRIERSLRDLAAAMGDDRPVAVSREITKLHEHTWRGPIGEAAEFFAEPTRGEIVIVVAGKPLEAEASESAILAALETELEGGESKRDAAAAVAARLGVSKRLAYDLVHQLDR